MQIQREADHGPKEVICEGLTKIYGHRQNKKALDSINLSFPSTGIFVLIGRNGSGKTTLVRILSTELEPTSGRASINGLDVMSQANALREKIAIVPQEARALPWMTPLQTVHSYLLWRGLHYGEAKRRALETLEELGIGQQATKLNRSLSGGTRRKVMVATVLASEAEVIFLDEPTTGLDPISRKEFWELLRKIGKERFTFLTTHYLEEAEQLADNIGVLESGKLVRLGTLDDLRKSVKYNYSLTLPPQSALPSLNLQKGELVRGADGTSKILTVEDEAFRISSELSKAGYRFTINPVSLDDIFFYLVRHEAGA